MHIAEDPLLCVVNGCGQVLEDWKRLQRVVDTPEFVRPPQAPEAMAPTLRPGKSCWRGLGQLCPGCCWWWDCCWCA